MRWTLNAVYKPQSKKHKSHWRYPCWWWERCTWMPEGVLVAVTNTSNHSSGLLKNSRQTALTLFPCQTTNSEIFVNVSLSSAVPGSLAGNAHNPLTEIGGSPLPLRIQRTEQTRICVNWRPAASNWRKSDRLTVDDMEINVARACPSNAQQSHLRPAIEVQISNTSSSHGIYSADLNRKSLHVAWTLHEFYRDRFAEILRHEINVELGRAIITLHPPIERKRSVRIYSAEWMLSLRTHRAVCKIGGPETDVRTWRKRRPVCGCGCCFSLRLSLHIERVWHNPDLSTASRASSIGTYAI